MRPGLGALLLAKVRRVGVLQLLCNSDAVESVKNIGRHGDGGVVVRGDWWATFDEAPATVLDRSTRRIPCDYPNIRLLQILEGRGRGR